MNCQLMGIKGCSNVEPKCGYADDILINLSNISDSVDGIESSREWTNNKLLEVQQEVFNDLLARMNVKVLDVNTAFRSSEIVKDCEPLHIKTYDQQEIRLQIQGIRLNSGTSTVTINDEVFADVGEGFTYDGEADEFNISVVGDVECHVLENDSNRKNCCSCSPCHADFEGNDSGLILYGEIGCDIDRWFCEKHRLICMLLKWKARLEIAGAMYTTSAIGKGLFNEEQLKNSAKLNAKKYDDNVDDIATRLRMMAKDSCCFECDSFSHATVLP